MWFDCIPGELDFFDVASFRLVTEVILPAPPLKVFQILADDESWPRWFKEIADITWTSQPPRAAGSTREVTLKTLGVRLGIQERFLAWDEGSRFAFSMDALSLPLLASGGEDYRLEPIGDEQTRLRWLFCYEPKILAKAVHPLARAFFRQMFRKAADRLAEYIHR